jgi:hypothetical protein
MRTPYILKLRSTSYSQCVLRTSLKTRFKFGLGKESKNRSDCLVTAQSPKRTLCPYNKKIQIPPQRPVGKSSAQKEDDKKAFHSLTLSRLARNTSILGSFCFVCVLALSLPSLPSQPTLFSRVFSSLPCSIRLATRWRGLGALPPSSNGPRSSISFSSSLPPSPCWELHMHKTRRH